MFSSYSYVIRNACIDAWSPFNLTAACGIFIDMKVLQGHNYEACCGLLSMLIKSTNNKF